MDKIHWIPSKTKKFEVRSFYHTLRPACTTFPLKGVCRNKALLQEAFFVRSTALGRIFTMHDLGWMRILVLVLHV